MGNISVAKGDLFDFLIDVELPFSSCTCLNIPGEELVAETLNLDE